jgi:MATE family multidrug resistance protein
MSTSDSASRPVAAAHSLRPTRDDLRHLVSLAVPVVVVQLGVMTMGAVDVIMVGHYSALDLAATALGNLYVFGTVVFGFGLIMAIDPIVSQAVGAGDTEGAARGVQRGILVAALVTLPMCLFMLPAEAILGLLGQPAETVPLAAAYVRASMFGVLPLVLFVALRQSLQAMRLLRPIVVTIVGANVLNAALVWVCVFGLYGAPTRGTVGAAVATAIARWAMTLGLLLIAWRHLRPYLVPLRRSVLEWPPLWRTLRLGAPIGTQYMLEYGVFALVALLMGWLGTVQMAAHQVAINIASLTFMVPLGVSSAASVLVGQAVGRGDSDSARRAAGAAIAVGFAFMALSAVVMLVMPGPLARGYSADAAVVAAAMVLLPIAGFFQVFDGLQVVSIGILRGTGDTRTPMIVNVLGFWLVGLPVSLWLGFSLGLGARGLWWGLVVGLAAVAVFLVLRVVARLSRDIRRLDIEGGAAH